MRLFLRSAVILLSVASIAPRASCQSGFVINDTQKVQLELNQFQQDIRRTKPGSSALSLDSITISTDGHVLLWQDFVQQFGALIAAMPGRNVVMTNPLPGKLGTLWDFEIIDCDLSFVGDRCIVKCQYRLRASGVRTGSGKIEFERISRGWRFSEINGFLPLLNQELSLLRGKQQGEKAKGEDIR
ncbi:MAG: hypothetical protein NT028_09030 [candidate division Zixibacteria bacterium]|nr:hypothetical protein [candidate division Zixibacteria bacterium]